THGELAGLDRPATFGALSGHHGASTRGENAILRHTQRPALSSTDSHGFATFDRPPRPSEQEWLSGNHIAVRWAWSRAARCVSASVPLPGSLRRAARRLHTPAGCEQSRALTGTTSSARAAKAADRARRWLAA